MGCPICWCLKTMFSFAMDGIKCFKMRIISSSRAAVLVMMYCISAVTCFVLHIQEKTTLSIWRAKSVLAHAYIISRRGMEAFLQCLPSMERGIDESVSFDITAMSVWQNMFCHQASNVIVQDYCLGTNNYWVADIPQKYVPWFQTVIVPKYFQYSQSVIRADWWRNSYFGRNFVWGIDDATIDDGHVLLKGLWLLDALVITLISLCNTPPFGYLAFFQDLPTIFAHLFYTRLSRERMNKGKTHMD